ncbi:hypothetical protein K0M31_002387 [Melipona bicolor]|uniref:Uncharacterized protein n=1 Tax=Melipona bicolor TaxID=60889 RepID=A0AA40GHE7_9HYME|nr:hypothetical protein K0M31_002387 [Melipona bicolor]
MELSQYPSSSSASNSKEKSVIEVEIKNCTDGCKVLQRLKDRKFLRILEETKFQMSNNKRTFNPTAMVN